MGLALPLNPTIIKSRELLPLNLSRLQDVALYVIATGKGTGHVTQLLDASHNMQCTFPNQKKPK